MPLTMDSVRTRALRALDQGAGVLRLAPTWVPRQFCVPGGRLKLHPDDLYAFGPRRGGIDERWLASTARADNGSGTTAEEGMSVVVDAAGARVGTLAEVVEELGPALLGPELWERHRGWPVLATLFDNQGPLPFHLHPAPKSEAYYFPPQLNGHPGLQPISFFGLRPGVERADVAAALAAFDRRDNRITDLSVGYRLVPGTGWDIPAGVLHAPGSLCAYEPQLAGDAFAMCESVNNGFGLDPELLWRDAPLEHRGDLDHLVGWLDWEANVDPDFHRERFMSPVGLPGGEGWSASSVVYRSESFSAKEVVIEPGRTARVRDAEPYGLIAIQGHGRLARHPIESPVQIRFGEPTADEMFVSAEAARAGVPIENRSACEPLVLLQLFGSAEGGR
jgi:hypothetical protein